MARRVLLAPIVALALLCCWPAPALAGNGCGAGPTSRLVPDRPVGIRFLPACNAHDRCYARLWVHVDETPALARRRCDRRFHQRMVRICLVRYVRFRYRACRGVAWLYYRAVRAFGGPAYTRAQRRA